MKVVHRCDKVQREIKIESWSSVELRKMDA